MELNLEKNLNKLIKDNNLNVSKLSELSGVNVQTLHNWLSGQKPKNIIQVKQVADFFGVSIEYLCFSEEPSINEINEYRDEINAGIFEVVLRRVKK